MKKVNIGMFYDDRTELHAEFYRAAYQAVDAEQYNLKTGVVNSREMTVTYDYPERNVQHVNRYMLIRDYQDAVKISGMDFQAIFSNVKDKECAWFIRTRLRPQL